MSRIDESTVVEAARLYLDGLSLNATARKLGVSSPGLRERLVRAGIKIRGPVPAVADRGPCRIDQCPNPAAYSSGLCNAHYIRLRRTGDPLGSTSRSLEQRFWSKVDKRGPLPEKLGACWLWTGAAKERGYGNFNRGPAHGGFIPAHRFAYEILVGPIPPETVHLHHRCETPRCVNPAHLQPVTYVEHGREHRLTHCRNGHDLSVHGCYRKDRRGALVYCRACRRAERGRARSTA